MSTYRYHADELAITVPPGFIDKSANVLEWPHSEGGVALMLRRAHLEPGKLGENAKKYFAQLESSLAAFRREPLPAFECTAPHEAICFRFREEGRVLYQVHLLLDLGTKMMFVVWGVDAQQRALLDEVVKTAMPTLLLRQD